MFRCKRFPVILRGVLLASVFLHTFQTFTLSTLGSSHVGIMHVGTLSARIPAFKAILKFALRRNCIRSMGMVSVGVQSRRNTKELTGERNHTNAACAVKASVIDPF